MKAVVLNSRGKDGIRLQDIPLPKLKPKHAIVELEASSLNRVDIYMRDSGAGITHSLPQIMGVDGVGRIKEISGESQFSVGQRVVLYPYFFCGSCQFCLSGEQPLCISAKLPGEHVDGTFANYICMPTQSLLPISESVDAAEASCLGVAYLTAWRMVFSKAGASAGKTVLIVGAGGGVALACVHLCKIAGCRVIATTSGEAKKSKLYEVGADAVIDYKEEDVKNKVMELTVGQGVDFAIDNVGELSWSSTLKSLKRGGLVVTCGATTGGDASAELQRMFIRQLSVLGSTMGNISELRSVVKAFEQGLFKPVIDSSYALEDFEDAFRRLESPERFGKVVLYNASFTKKSIN
ncbi:zinc-binding dehydrogenase [Marinobacter salarius]|uniref:zinc-binding dehydrogenase n=1 Tax=Marinobacter salarius TaxID=1420917 RepID=UPI00273CDD10|nr:zinc-binding dehydrogenase [Marinobacter salarius]MDP4532891.1 zinc-binding dehydrogenase [Marinobacter salarius]